MLSTALVVFTSLIMGAAGAVAPAPSSLAIPEKALEGVQLGGIEPAEFIQLSKRATEGIHLVNCQGGGLSYSLEIYCADDGNCNHLASSSDECFLSTSGLFTWEGRTNQGCGFPSGVPFFYTLPSDAASRSDFSKVGTGSNKYHSYNVFKDNKHVMYTDGNGAVCRSIYYILQA